MKFSNLPLILAVSMTFWASHNGMAQNVNISSELSQGPKVLLVVAHPDDEYYMAGTIYRISKELGGTVDQLVITNGEGGYKYSLLAEPIYGVELTREEIGRKYLPEIRKQELLNAGEILGVREHRFLDQTDFRFTLDPEEGLSQWDRSLVLTAIQNMLSEGDYDFVFTVLPQPETHGHHKAASLLALEAVAGLSGKRPVILGFEYGESLEQPPVSFEELAGYPLSRIDSEAPVLHFDRTRKFGFNDKLDYQIVVSWMIAEHKSQGAFQTYHGKHPAEYFWVFEMNGPEGREKAQALSDLLSPQ